MVEPVSWLSERIAEGRAGTYGVGASIGAAGTAVATYATGMGLALSIWLITVGSILVLMLMLQIRIQRRVGIAMKDGQENRRRIAEAQAMPLLHSQLNPPLPVGPLGAWTLDSWALLLLVRRIRKQANAVVVELGSGASTPVLAVAVKDVGGELCSIEHDHQWAVSVKEQLSLWDLEDVATVHTIPLDACPAADGAEDKGLWYRETEVLTALPERAIDVLLVDGPPGGLQRVRTRAFPILRPKLAPGATIVVDDYDRPSERSMIEEWKGAEPAMEVRILKGRKQTAILSMPGSE